MRGHQLRSTKATKLPTKVATKLMPALKGRDIPAQGNALGNEAKQTSPEGAGYSLGIRRLFARCKPLPIVVACRCVSGMLLKRRPTCAGALLRGLPRISTTSDDNRRQRACRGGVKMEERSTTNHQSPINLKSRSLGGLGVLAVNHARAARRSRRVAA